MKNISCTLLGPGEIISGHHNYGLCNQMFQIASVISYAHDNGIDAIFPVLRDGDKYGKYTENIFRKLTIDEDVPGDHCVYTSPKFNYNPIPLFD